jgi:hypothetical protein
MSKMGLHDSFGHLKHKLWPKEGSGIKLAIWLPTTKSRESNWQFDFRPLKVGNRPNFLLFRWRARYCWKVINKGYNFALYLISITGLHRKLCTPKVVRIPTLGILGLPLGNPGTKCHLDASPMAKHKVYYKGEGSGFPQVWAVVSLVSSSLPVVNYNTKSASTKH